MGHRIGVLSLSCSGGLNFVVIIGVSTWCWSCAIFNLRFQGHVYADTVVDVMPN